MTSLSPYTETYAIHYALSQSLLSHGFFDQFIPHLDGAKLTIQSPWLPTLEVVMSVLWCVLDSTLLKDSVLWCVLVQRCLRLSKVYDPIEMKKFSESICLVITMAFKKTKILENNRRRKQIRGGVDISDHDRELSRELPRRCCGVCLI